MQYNAYEVVAAMVWTLHRSLLWWWCSVSPPELLWFLPLARTRLKTGFFLWIICAKLKLARRARVRTVNKIFVIVCSKCKNRWNNIPSNSSIIASIREKSLGDDRTELSLHLFLWPIFDHSSKGFSSLRENNNQRWLHHLDWKEPLPSGILIEDKTKWGVFFLNSQYPYLHNNFESVSCKDCNYSVADSTWLITQ